MTMEEYISIYEHKTGERFQPKPGFTLIYSPDRGFCEYKIADNMIMLYQVCGDGAFFVECAAIMAKVWNLHMIGTIIIRKNIKAVIRRYGHDVIKEIVLGDGSVQYLTKDTETGEKGRFSPAWKNLDGSYAYYVTWTV